MKSHLIIFLGLASISAVLISGCVVSPPNVDNVYTGLQSEDPTVRIQAAIKAGKERDTKAIPLLVDCLDDTEPDVRMFSGMALKRIVGDKTFEELGWKFYLPRQERREAVHRWQTWVAKNCGNGQPSEWEKLDALFKDEKGKAAGGGQNVK